MTTVDNEFPVIDRVVPSFADIKISLTPLGAPLIAMKMIKSISTGSTVEVGEMVGASGGRVMATTTGLVKYNYSMVLYRPGFEQLIEALAAAAKPFAIRGNEIAISLVHFNADLIWTPPGAIQKSHRRCKGLRIISDTNNPTEGTDPDELEVGCHAKVIANVLANGREVVML
jgi:hypothetical protein